MNNYFQEKKRTASLQPVTPQKKRKVMLNNSFNERKNQFLQSLNPALANCLINGLYPVEKPPKETAQPIKLHKFRNEKERIECTVNDFSQSHLNRDLYLGVAKLKLRERVISLEGPQWKYETRPRLRKDEAEQQNKYNKSVLDATAKDMTMVYFPQWKSDTKDKWQQDKGFLTTVYPRADAPQLTSDVYIDGFEVLGELQRSYDKEECNVKDFRCTTKSCHEPMPSISLRKNLQDLAYNQFIQNSLYPSECSTNQTRYPKIYNKSVRQEILQIAKKQLQDD